jgi:L-ectoine synthase
MFIRRFEDVENTDHFKIVLDGALRSARYITASDGMGFSLHVNRARPCPPMTLWYKNHWEANYIISGLIDITDLTTNEKWQLGAGDLYQVGPNDLHYFEVIEHEHHLSIFCPALTGTETHDEDGAYSPSGPVPQTSQRMFLRRIEEMRAQGKGVATADDQANVITGLDSSDGMGFNFSDTRFVAGANTELWDNHHWQSNYIVSGTGTVENLATGEVWQLEPDITFNATPKERYRISAQTELHLVSVSCPVFNPT